MRLVANRSMTYATRRLQAGDEFDANSRDSRILLALKRASELTAKAEKPAKAKKPSDDDGDLASLRAEYQEVVGKRAYHGWDASELRQRIDEVGRE